MALIMFKPEQTRYPIDVALPILGDDILKNPFTDGTKHEHLAKVGNIALCFCTIYLLKKCPDHDIHLPQHV